jgi:DNA-directed RNA polymerase subunit RPC12/RpoP
VSTCYSSGPHGDGVVLDSVIQCPHCGTSKTERMPLDACQIVYECSGCGIKLRPKTRQAKSCKADAG